MWKQLIFDISDELKDALIGELSDLAVAGIREDDSEKPGHTHLTAYFPSEIGRAHV